MEVEEQSLGWKSQEAVKDETEQVWKDFYGIGINNYWGLGYRTGRTRYEEIRKTARLKQFMNNSETHVENEIPARQCPVEEWAEKQYTEANKRIGRPPGSRGSTWKVRGTVRIGFVEDATPGGILDSVDKYTELGTVNDGGDDIKIIQATWEGKLIHGHGRNEAGLKMGGPGT